jgi:hypothetical protein
MAIREPVRTGQVTVIVERYMRGVVIVRRTFKQAVCALAIGAIGSSVAASGAQAGSFASAAYPAAITGQQAVQVKFTTTVGAVKCGVATFSGVLVEEREELEVVPVYKECTLAGLAAKVDFTTGECSFLFTAGETITAEKVAVKRHLKCGKSGKVDISVVGAECRMTIAPQTLEGFTAETSGAGLLFIYNANKISYEMDKPEACPNEAKTMTGAEADGKLTATFTVTGSLGQLRVT